MNQDRLEVIFQRVLFYKVGEFRFLSLHTISISRLKTKEGQLSELFILLIGKEGWWFVKSLKKNNTLLNENTFACKLKIFLVSWFHFDKKIAPITGRLFVCGPIRKKLNCWWNFGFKFCRKCFWIFNIFQNECTNYEKCKCNFF